MAKNISKYDRLLTISLFARMLNFQIDACISRKDTTGVVGPKESNKKKEYYKILINTGRLMNRIAGIPIKSYDETKEKEKQTGFDYVKFVIKGLLPNLPFQNLKTKSMLELVHAVYDNLINFSKQSAKLEEPINQDYVTLLIDRIKEYRKNKNISKTKTICALLEKIESDIKKTKSYKKLYFSAFLLVVIFLFRKKIKRKLNNFSTYLAQITTEKPTENIH